MCLNRGFAHARAVLNGFLMGVSASGWSLHLSCLCSYLILLHTSKVCFEEDRLRA